MTSAIRSRAKRTEAIFLLSKFEDDVIFEYHITVMDDDFNLGCAYHADTGGSI